jgi:hypothetical protein
VCYDLLGSLARGSQKRIILYHRSGSLQLISESLFNLRLKACTSLWRLPEGTCLDAKNGVITWGLPAGTLVPRGGDCDVSHCLGMGCAYMYKLIILDITRFKAVLAMNLLEQRSQACFCKSSIGMYDLLRSLVRES